MTLSQKGRRTITVNQQQYHWIASGNDMYLMVIIELAQQPMQKLLVQVNDYYEDDTEVHSSKGNSVQTTVISSLLIRKAIEHAYSCGWSIKPSPVLSFSYLKGIFTQRAPF